MPMPEKVLGIETTNSYKYNRKALLNELEEIFEIGGLGLNL